MPPSQHPQHIEEGTIHSSADTLVPSIHCTIKANIAGTHHSEGEHLFNTGKGRSVVIDESPAFRGGGLDYLTSLPLRSCPFPHEKYPRALRLIKFSLNPCQVPIFFHFLQVSALLVTIHKSFVALGHSIDSLVYNLIPLRHYSIPQNSISQNIVINMNPLVPPFVPSQKGRCYEEADFQEQV